MNDAGNRIAIGALYNDGSGNMQGMSEFMIIHLILIVGARFKATLMGRLQSDFLVAVFLYLPLEIGSRLVLG